jgi:ribonucleotide reductase alpha subunit
MGVVEGGLISKASGGLGLDVSRIRHSKINTSGLSSGIVPMLRLYNEMARYCDQGGKRKGAICINNRPHHIDILPFIDIVKKKGDKDARAHDINTSIWSSWLFWKRVRQQGVWTLFCPAHTPELNHIYGEEFEKKYMEFEELAEKRENEFKVAQNKLEALEAEIPLSERATHPKLLEVRDELMACKTARINHRVMKAQDLLKAIVEAQRNAGMPYIMHGDASNIKSNHRHLGYIRTTNLCQEIIEYTSNEEIASCLTGETLVLTSTGLQRIDSIGSSPVYTPFASDQNLSLTSSFTDSIRLDRGLKEVYLVKTNGGPSFRATADHLFLVKEGGSVPMWKRVDQMTVSSELIVPLPTIPGCEDWSSDVFEMGRRTQEKDLLTCILSSGSYVSQCGLILGYVLGKAKVADGVIDLKIEDWSLVEPLFVGLLSMGIAPYKTNVGIVVSGWSAKRLYSICGLPYKWEVPEQPLFLTYQVDQIMYDGFEKVYDLYVPNVHHFCANGFISHNCNLASISLKKFVKGPVDHTASIDHQLPLQYDFDLLGKVSQSVTRNLNKVIDHNWYPLDDLVASKGKISVTNKKHRPLGIGVSGLAEAIYGLDLLFDGPETKLLNKAIFACMYYNCLIASIELALVHGPYESFPGSPFSEGKLQFDLWKEEFQIKGPNALRKAEDDEPLEPCIWGQQPVILSNGDTVLPTWDDLKRCVKAYGTRNSLFLALMPTASTAQILQNTETTEAPMSNLYSRKVLNGAYPVLNMYLVSDLKQIGMWNEHTVKFIIANEGSVKGLGNHIVNNPTLFGTLTPDASSRLMYLESKYKTMFEYKQGLFLRLAADRGRYIDQSQSTNIYLKDPRNEELMALHLQTDMLGLKTGMYYLRSAPSEEPIKFTADPSLVSSISNKYLISDDSGTKCNNLDENGSCLSCS